MYELTKHRCLKHMLCKKNPKLSINNGGLLSSMILLVNAFVSLFCISSILREIVTVTAFSDYEVFMIWSTNFCGAVVSIIAGAFFVGKFHKQTHFLLFWILFGIISSITPIFMDMASISNVLAASALLSVSLGLGLPVCMAMFADHTVIENRARLGGMTLLFIMVLGALTSNFITENMITSSLVLACWRGIALIVFFIADSKEGFVRRRNNISFGSVLQERSFILYIVPWTMFSLVNYLSAPITINIHGEGFMYILVLIGNILTGVFAIFGGYLSDTIGRKRLTITGFIILGLGYAILGIYPQNRMCLYFYTVVDGIAWGIFFVIFFFTIWGDLAYGKSSEKYYALGSLPYLLSNFLRLTAGPFISNVVSAYAIFSFATFFLFLAVIPLMYAPETLPEKKIKERELKRYIEKAKKVREKYE